MTIASTSNGRAAGVAVLAALFTVALAPLAAQKTLAEVAAAAAKQLHDQHVPGLSIAMLAMGSPEPSAWDASTIATSSRALAGSAVRSPEPTVP